MDDLVQSQARCARTCPSPASTATRSDAMSPRTWLSTIPPSMLASSPMASTAGTASARSSPPWRIRSSASASSRSQASNPAAACSRRLLVAAGDLGGQRPDRAPRQPRLLEPGDEPCQRLLQPRQRRHASEGLGQPGHHLRATEPDRRRRQLVPAAEVVVKLALARPRRRQHLIHGCRRDPALGEQLRSPLHDPLPAGAPAPGYRLTRHAPMLALDCTRQSSASRPATS